MNRAKTVLPGVATRRILQLAGNCTDLKEAIEIVTENLANDVTCPPTDLPALFDQLKVVKCVEADIPVNGELHRLGRGFEIYYSPQQSDSRRRFTIAHELGHTILASTGPRCPQSGDEVERICDMLAASLLMPRSYFLKAIGSNRSPDMVLNTAKIFEVSVIAAALRFTALVKTSVFEVEGGRVSWGQGLIRKGTITSDIKPCVDKALKGESGEEVLFLNDGRSQVRLQWVVYGGWKKALFTATQVR